MTCGGGAGVGLGEEFEELERLGEREELDELDSGRGSRSGVTRDVGVKGDSGEAAGDVSEGVVAATGGTEGGRAESGLENSGRVPGRCVCKLEGPGLAGSGVEIREARASMR
jgi:hypothetical protein